MSWELDAVEPEVAPAQRGVGSSGTSRTPKLLTLMKTPSACPKSTAQQRAPSHWSAASGQPANRSCGVPAAASLCNRLFRISGLQVVRSSSLGSWDGQNWALHPGVVGGERQRSPALFQKEEKQISFFEISLCPSPVSGQRSAVVRRPSILQAPHHPVRPEMVHKECRFWVISGSPSAHA